MTHLIQKLTLILALFCSAVGFSQALEVTAELQQALGQLSPEQRIAVLRALRETDDQSAPFIIDSQVGGQLNSQTLNDALKQAGPRVSARQKRQAEELKQSLKDNPTPAIEWGDSIPSIDELYAPEAATPMSAEMTAEATPLPGADINAITPANNLALEDTAPAGLQPFGYDIFLNPPDTFAPVDNAPVPENYPVGPGDTLQILLFGKENRRYTLAIERDGTLNVPKIGPISTTGLTFAELKTALNEYIEEQLIGVNASINMGNLRAMQVFVLGDVVQPGAYTISALSTISNALIASGGVKPTGSLRRIQHKRGRQRLGELDLYDLLLRGDARGDRRLQPGDVIFVPPVGTTVGVDGAVRRPAIYELRRWGDVGDMLALAGGLAPDADARAAYIERFSRAGERTLVDLDLNRQRDIKLKVKTGDVIQVPAALETLEQVVMLQGHVKRPGSRAWRSGLRVSDIIRQATDLKPGADLRYAVITRQSAADQRLQIVNVELDKALQQPGSTWDVPLDRQDQLWVFGLEENRAITLLPVVEQLRAQAGYLAAEPVVSITGAVRFPGEYPLQPGMRVSKLLHAARELLPEADLDYALLVRYQAGSSQPMQPITLNLQQLLQGLDTQVDQVLQGRDQLYVFDRNTDRADILASLLDGLESQAHKDQRSQIISVQGLVRLPGEYPLTPGMRVSDVLRAGGGLSESAYAMSAELTRYNVTDTGRTVQHLPVDLAAIRQGDVAANLSLQPRDLLTVKRLPQSQTNVVVELRGEVQFPGRYPVKPGESLSAVIDRAGGLTAFAYPDGAIFSRERIKQRETEQANVLAARLEKELSELALQQANNDPQKANAFRLAQGLLDKLNNYQSTGRLVIDLGATLNNPGTQQDIALMDGDVLIIPRESQSVTVLGEVQYPTSHLFKAGRSRNDYINLSGGLSENADEARVYVVRANGEVLVSSRTRWFGGGRIDIRPGDTIVAPLDADRIQPLRLATDITRILSQVGLAAASFKAVGAF